MIPQLPLSEISAAGARSPIPTREECLRRLIVRYQREDTEAGERLVYRLSPVLTKYLRHSHTPPSEREDVLQDCWIRIHRACHTYRETEPVLPWVYAVARHTQLDAYRRRRRRQSREIAMEKLPEAVLAPRGNAAEVMQLLDRLPVSQRDVLLMMKVEGWSVPEIASALSSSEGAVKQKAHRAYAALRSMLVAS